MTGDDEQPPAGAPEPPALSRSWRCLRCGWTVRTDEPIAAPLPCVACYSIFFEAIPTHETDA
jgi:hypothetical protein